MSFLARSIVGPEGAVIGVDRSPEAVAVAQQRAQTAQLSNMQFIASDVYALTLDQLVDALIGRLVLMYFSKPADVLRKLLAFVKPGGLVMFQEIDATSVAAEPMCDEFWVAGQRINQAFARAGIELRAGLKLPSIFQEAGLSAPQTLQMARVEHGSDAQGYAWIEQLTRTLLPLMQKTGVATPEEVMVDTLAARIREEAVAKQAVLVLSPFIGAWAYTPAVRNSQKTGGAFPPDQPLGEHRAVDDLRRELSRAAQRVADYRERLPGARVAPVAGSAEVRRAFDGELPGAPALLAQVVDELVAGATPVLMASAGPRYFGFVVGGSLDAALVADILTTGWDQNAFNEAFSPAAIAVEDVVGRWLKELLGLPALASVGFVTGAQGANIVGLAAARWWVLH